MTNQVSFSLMASGRSARQSPPASGFCGYAARPAAQFRQ